MTNSLNLAGDGDDVELLAEVERTFGIAISDREAQATLTVGQLCDLIEAKCGRGATQRCLSQVAFYRLRRALRELGIASAIVPATPVSVIEGLGERSVHRVWTRVGRQAGLTLPGLALPVSDNVATWGGWMLLFSLMIAGAAGLHALDKVLPFWLALIVVWVAFPLAGVATMSIAHRLLGVVPRRILTIGDLAREAAGHSFSALSQQQSASRTDRWFALLAILRPLSGYQGPITRETTFFPR